MSSYDEKKERIQAMKAKNSFLNVKVGTLAILAGGFALSSNAQTITPSKFTEKMEQKAEIPLKSQRFVNKKNTGGHYNLYENIEHNKKEFKQKIKESSTLNEKKEIKEEYKDYLSSIKKKNFFHNRILSSKSKSMIEAVNKAKVRTDSVEISVKDYNVPGAAYYDPIKNSISDIFIKVDTTGIGHVKEAVDALNKLKDIVNSPDRRNFVKAHELGHEKNDQNGFHDCEFSIVNNKDIFEVSIEDKDKMFQLDEISADINAVLYARELFLETGKFPDDIKEDLGSYIEAIEKGIIDPFSNNPEMQESEQNFIVDFCIKDWNENRKQDYESQVTENVDYYVNLIKETNSKVKEISSDVVINEKMKKGFTFIYNGKETDFSKFVDLSKIETYEKNKESSKEVEEHKDRTFDATNLFIKTNQKAL